MIDHYLRELKECRRKIDCAITEVLTDPEKYLPDAKERLDAARAQVSACIHNHERLLAAAETTEVKQ